MSGKSIAVKCPSCGSVRIMSVYDWLKVFERLPSCAQCGAYPDHWLCRLSDDHAQLYEHDVE